MPVDPSLENITFALGMSAAASVVLLAGISVTAGTLINALDLYKERKRDHKAQQEGNPRREYSLEKPSRLQAFCDACKFDWAYIMSLGRVNTSNYDFEVSVKPKNIE